MVKVVVYHIPHGNYANMSKRSSAFRDMETSLSDWAKLGWKVVSVNAENTVDDMNYVVFLQK